MGRGIVSEERGLDSGDWGREGDWERWGRQAGSGGRGEGQGGGGCIRDSQAKKTGKAFS